LCERLFLDEKFAIGQTFRRMQTPPQFALLDCGVGFGDGKNTLWRRYTLSTEGFVCDITEVFPDRDMFNLGERWLDEGQNVPSVTAENSKLRYGTNMFSSMLDGIYSQNPTKLLF
jgi:hypothetical protein